MECAQESVDRAIHARSGDAWVRGLSGVLVRRGTHTAGIRRYSSGQCCRIEGVSDIDTLRGGSAQDIGRGDGRDSARMTRPSSPGCSRTDASRQMARRSRSRYYWSRYKVQAQGLMIDAGVGSKWRTLRVAMLARRASAIPQIIPSRISIERPVLLRPAIRVAVRAAATESKFSTLPERSSASSVSNAAVNRRCLVPASMRASPNRVSKTVMEVVQTDSGAC